MYGTISTTAVNFVEASVLFDVVVWAGSLLSVTKQWNSNDHLSLQFPIALRTEAIKGKQFWKFQLLLKYMH